MTVLEEQLSTLNKEQLEAVTTVQGPLLVIAGAGSGKTRVLTLRIAYLLAQGIPASRILALTFTNKAADEMRSRIASIVGYEEAAMVNAGTFHSVFLRILRREVAFTGYDENFSVRDTTACLRMLRRVMRDMHIDDKAYKAERMARFISLCKNQLVLPEHYVADPRTLERDTKIGLPLRGKIYQEYAMYMKRENAMDFDDLLFNMFLLLYNNPSIRKKYQNIYQFILVDEFQDTNSVQNVILTYLVGSHKNICVVGDDSQSIYAFRGAKVENILNFRKDYKEAKEIKLELNYRSTANIVNSANRLIAHNRLRLDKECQATGAPGERVKIRRFATQEEEAAAVAYEIKVLAESERLDYADFAVLYRNNSMARTLEFMFKAQRIPTQIYGGNSVFERREIQDLLAYFRLVCNPDDDDAFLRIVNTPRRGLGDKSLQPILNGARVDEVSCWRYLSDLDFGYEFSAKAKASLLTFREMVKVWVASEKVLEAAELAKVIYVDSGLKQYFADESEEDTVGEGLGRMGNVQELFAQIELGHQSFVENGNDGVYRLSMFLDEISLLSEQDRVAAMKGKGKDKDNGEDADKDKKEKPSKRHSVTLSTVHSSKGLEFNYVYVVGMEDGTFPSQRAIDSNVIEEERRLCYVAMTRAAKRLTMTYSEKREILDRGALRTKRLPPSRFLREIQPDYLMEAGKTVDTIDSELLGFEDTPSGESQEYAVGDIVEHRTFGRGRVARIMGRDSDMRMVVEFEEKGQRTLMLRYAKLVVVSRANQRESHEE